MALAALCAPAARLWSAITDPMVKWQVYAAPAIQSISLTQDALLVVHANGLMALNISDGKKKWGKKYESGLEKAALCREAVLVASSQGTLASLRAADGSILWQIALPVRGKLRVSCLRDAVLFIGDGGVVGIRLKDGQILWNYAAHETATAAASLDGRLYLSSRNSLTALEESNGKEISSKTLPAASHLLASDNPPSIYLIYPDKITALHPQSLATLWVKTMAVDVASPPATQKNRLLVLDQEGMLRFIDFKDGEDKGQYFIGLQTPYAPETTQDAVYLAAANDFLYGINSQGKELWRSQCGPVIASPLYRDDVLYAANAAGRVIAFVQHAGRQDLEEALTAEFGLRSDSKGSGVPKQARVTHFLVRREIERLAERLSAEDAAQAGPKPAVAVLMLEDLTRESRSPAAGLTDMLIDAFAGSAKYMVVERTRLHQVAEELKLSLSGAVDRDKALRVGRLVAAQRIVTGSVSAVGEFYELNARMTETETGVLLKSGSVQIRKKLLGKP